MFSHFQKQKSFNEYIRGKISSFEIIDIMVIAGGDNIIRSQARNMPLCNFQRNQMEICKFKSKEEKEFLQSLVSGRP